MQDDGVLPNANPSNTTLCTTIAAPEKSDTTETYPYSSIVGQLSWISILTHPDIAYQVRVGQLPTYYVYPLDPL